MKDKKKRVSSPANSGGGIYFFGMIGSLLWFLHISYGFWPSILAILKAFIWPVFFTYDVFRFVH
jgi:hypothetical protein